MLHISVPCSVQPNTSTVGASASTSSHPLLYVNVCCGDLSKHEPPSPFSKSSDSITADDVSHTSSAPDDEDDFLHAVPFVSEVKVVLSPCTGNDDETQSANREFPICVLSSLDDGEDDDDDDDNEAEGNGLSAESVKAAEAAQDHYLMNHHSSEDDDDDDDDEDDDDEFISFDYDEEVEDCIAMLSETSSGGSASHTTSPALTFSNSMAGSSSSLPLMPTISPPLSARQHHNEEIEPLDQLLDGSSSTSVSSFLATAQMQQKRYHMLAARAMVDRMEARTLLSAHQWLLHKRIFLGEISSTNLAARVCAACGGPSRIVKLLRRAQVMLSEMGRLVAAMPTIEKPHVLATSLMKPCEWASHSKLMELYASSFAEVQTQLLVPQQVHAEPLPEQQVTFSPLLTPPPPSFCLDDSFDSDSAEYEDEVSDLDMVDGDCCCESCRLQDLGEMVEERYVRQRRVLDTLKATRQLFL